MSSEGKTNMLTNTRVEETQQSVSNVARKPAKIMIVVGARPNFMKAAPLIASIRAFDQKRKLQSAAASAEQGIVSHVLVHTGQHYDEAMSGSFFADLGIPKPNVYLGVGSGSHAAQTAEIMRKFEEVLLSERPDALIIVGDVNSTVACALVAAKISFDGQGTRPLIAHVEAGLRSFDKGMPEEVNRILTDHLSDLLFVTEESGVQNLLHEGVDQEKIHFVGNTMIDSLMAFLGAADKSPILTNLGLRQANDGVSRYALLTLHRPSNVDQFETFSDILNGIKELSASMPIIFPVHPRTRKRIVELGLQDYFAPGENLTAQSATAATTPSNRIHLVDPLGYIDFLCMMKHAAMVVTDSGGIQEETTCLGVPCVTVRENTERPITVTCGTNRIAGTNPREIRKVISEQISRRNAHQIPALWDGKAAERISALLLDALRQRKLVDPKSSL
jgi:UDP-N-acetylglucosamine 2-epimerase (non-hydrolysing)